LRRPMPSNREYRRYEAREEQDPAGPPDVLLDVPELRVDSIHPEVDDLDAHVALKARVLNLIKLNVGIDVHLSRVKLDIKWVEAELVLKARLEHVTAIVDRLMTSLDRNPELVKAVAGEIRHAASDEVHCKPRIRVSVYADVPASAEVGSERENLPARLEPGVTYRDFAVRWRAAAYLEEPDDEV
jgi:hypothetical protein